MQSITITAVVDEKRRIMIDLPDDIPTGTVRITVQPIDEQAEEYEPGSREWARARLIAAGLVNPNAHYAPEDAEEMSEEEEEILGRKLAGSRPVEDYINEDREERF
jgi:hypothetical protein